MLIASLQWNDIYIVVKVTSLKLLQFKVNWTLKYFPYVMWWSGWTQTSPLCIKPTMHTFKYKNIEYTSSLQYHSVRSKHYKHRTEIKLKLDKESGVPITVNSHAANYSIWLDGYWVINSKQEAADCLMISALKHFLSVARCEGITGALGPLHSCTTLSIFSNVSIYFTSGATWTLVSRK